jgi:DNA-binding LytR/AlgR family response regulator
MGKQNISVLVVESDPESLKYTIELLHKNSLVSNIESVADSDHALLKIIVCSPDIVFLEYPAIGNSGEQLIKFIQTKLTETTIVFVSRTKEYAANAIHKEIFNYLLKPISKGELDKVIANVNLYKQTNIQARINQIIEKIPDDTRLKLQTSKGYLIVAPDEILYCKADGFYSELHLTNDRVELSYQSLSKLDEILGQYNFFRASRSIYINMKYIRKIYRNTNTIVLSREGKEYEVKGSRNHIKNLSQFDSD